MFLSRLFKDHPLNSDRKTYIVLLFFAYQLLLHSKRVGNYFFFGLAPY